MVLRLMKNFKLLLFAVNCSQGSLWLLHEFIYYIAIYCVCVCLCFAHPHTHVHTHVHTHTGNGDHFTLNASVMLGINKQPPCLSEMLSLPGRVHAVDLGFGDK